MTIRRWALGLTLSVITLMGECTYYLSTMKLPLDVVSEAYDKYEVSNDVFKVRVSAHQEIGIFLPGAYITCESAKVNSEDWQMFKSYRWDDPVPVPRDKVKFVSDQMAYIHMGSDYMLTTNSGQNWVKHHFSEGWIKSAKIAEDGQGMLHVSEYTLDEKPREILYQTLSYGQYWYRVDE